MPRGHKRNLSNGQSQSDSKLRKSSSADALDLMSGDAAQTDLDYSTSQPVTINNPTTSANRPTKRGKHDQNKINKEQSANDRKCGHCSTLIKTSDFDILFLECCFCKGCYHSCCLNIDESLEQFLYVVTDIGGWSCPKCRVSLSQSIISRNDGTEKNKNSQPGNSSCLEKLSSEIKILQSQIQTLSEGLSGVMVKMTSHENSGSSLVGKMNVFHSSFSQVVKGSQTAEENLDKSQNGRGPSTETQQHAGVLASNLDNQFRTAVLSAVHSEMKSISKRSTNIIVSGFSKRSNISDKDHFLKFCSEFFSFEPKIISTRRLGREENSRIQPLLVTFSNLADSEYLISNAKQLRTVDDSFVRI